MGLMLFSEHNINLNVFGLRVAPQWIQNINTLVIVIGGPLMALLFKRLREQGWNIDIPSQFAASLFCMGLGMLVLPIGIHLAGADGLVAFKWIAISYVLQSFGELLISPIGYAMIGKLAPASLQGLLMGCWMMVTGVASVLAGYVSSAMPQNIGSSPVATNLGYSSVFNMLGWGSLAGGVVLLLLVPRLRLLLTHASFSGSFVLILGAVVLVLLCVMTARHPDAAERSRMVAYLILALGSLIFWSLYQLAPMGLMLFSEHNINLNVFGLRVAPQWIQNINTLVIVIGGPLMALLFKRLREQGWNIDIPSQFAASLFCMGLGMLVLPLGIHLAGADGLVAFKWIAISYVLQSFGELLISPIGYAMIGKLAPASLQGLMMGCWMMVTGVASVLAGYVSGA
ncbi:MAG: hypothetical protein ACRC9G_17170, partial [Aeromonas veronii]